MDMPQQQAATPERAMTVAILGGTGFIGRSLGRYLADLGHDVIAVARHQPAEPIAGRMHALDLTTADVATVSELLLGQDGRPVDAVVNAAGGMWGLTDEQMYDANVTLVDRLIAAIEPLPHRPLLIQIGSVHEYGLVPIGESIGEEAQPNPVMRYGELKLRCTEAIATAVGAGRIDGVTLRIGNVVGAGQPEVSLLGVVARQLRTALEEERPAVLNLGPLGSQRDFLGLTDAMRAITLAMSVPLDGQVVINVGSGSASTAREMVRLLIEVSGLPTELTEKVADGPAETQWQQLQVDRAREVLRWSPSPDLRDEVKQLWGHTARG